MVTPFHSRSGYLPIRWVVFLTIVTVGLLAVPKPPSSQICRPAVAITPVSESPLVKSFLLGNIEGIAVQGGVEISPNHSYDGEGDGPLYNVRVYCANEATGSKTNVLCAGESYEASITENPQIVAGEDAKVWAGAYSFTAPAHKQLLVSTRLGRCCSYVYDYDPSSRKIRIIYAMESGRVVVRPRLNKNGRYDLEESWQKNQWEDRDDLGLGHYNSRTGYVSRRLHWNGTRFVPDNPGALRLDK